MLLLESNIGSVTARIRRLRNHDIPVAMQRALSPSRWDGLAYLQAEAVLKGVAKPEQWDRIPAFLATLKVLALPEGFALRMRTPFTPTKTLSEFQGSRAAMSAKDLSENLFLGSVQQFEDWITEWVEQEKEKDKRDTGKTDEEIGQFISYIMLTPNPTPAELEARQKLLPHIVDWIQRKQENQKLDPVTAQAWLRAVLATWHKMVCAHFGTAFRQQLRLVRGELPTG